VGRKISGALSSLAGFGAIRSRPGAAIRSDGARFLGTLRQGLGLSARRSTGEA